MGTTYNLILESKTFESGLFAKGPIAEEGTIIFLSSQEKMPPLFTITTDYNPRMREIRNKNCGWQTVVDISSHIVDVEIAAKAKDHVSKFIVHLRIETRVIDPKIIYQNWITDLADYVRQDLEGIVEEIAHELDIECDHTLKDQLKAHLQNKLQLEGIEISVKNISVGYDPDTEAHLRELLNTKRKEKLFINKQEVAQEIGKKLDGDTGALMDILDGKRPISDIVEVRRELRKNKINDAIDEVTKQLELLNQLMNSGALSEMAAQNAMKNLLPKLGVSNQELLEEQESNIFAPPDEEESP